MHNAALLALVASILGCGGAVDVGTPEADANVDDAAIGDATTDSGNEVADASGDADTSADGGGDGVTCGGSRCLPPSFCQICRPDLADAPRTCTTDVSLCKDWGATPPLRISCDDHEDCAMSERCVLFEGSDGTYAKCLSMPTTDCKGFMSIVCSSLADCPPCAKQCAHYRAGYPLKTCQ